MTRRAPIVILACVLLGAVTSTGLAMLCAALANPGDEPGRTLQPLHAGLSDIVVAQTCFGHTRLNRARVDLALDFKTGGIQTCRWQNDGETFSECRAGWPFRALRCENHGDVTIVLADTAMRMQRTGLNPVVGGWELRDFQGGKMGSTWRAIPLQPIWPGLFADTLIFAAMWWLLLAGTGLARGMSRRRRGLCPGCGYDVRSGGAAHARCPECGQATRAQPPETSPPTPD